MFDFFVPFNEWLIAPKFFECLADHHYLLDLNPTNLYLFLEYTEQADETMINVIALFKASYGPMINNFTREHNGAAS